MEVWNNVLNIINLIRLVWVPIKTFYKSKYLTGALRELVRWNVTLYKASKFVDDLISYSDTYRINLGGLPGWYCEQHIVAYFCES